MEMKRKNEKEKYLVQIKESIIILTCYTFSTLFHPLILVLEISYFGLNVFDLHWLFDTIAQYDLHKTNFLNARILFPDQKNSSQMIVLI